MRVNKLIGLGVLFVAIPAVAGDWTAFRGSDGSGVSSDKNLPTKWDEKTGFKWKAALPGRGLSNPIFHSGKIFLTACSGYRETRLHVLCLEEKTGKKLWERQFTATGNTGCHPMTNMAAPTPVTDGKNVYALFATGDLAALDIKGTLLWYRSLVGDYPKLTNQVGMAASPVLTDKVLLLPMDSAGESFIAGIDTKTGKNLWKNKRPSDINWTTPILFKASGKTLALFVNAREALAVDPETGKSRWSFKGRLESIQSPTQGQGLIFLPGGEMKAIKAGIEGTPETVWSAEKVTGGFASPTYHNKRVYGLTKTHVKCLDAKNGKEVWSKGGVRVDGPFSASPVIADGKLYAVNNKGRTYVIQLGDQPKLLARNDLKDTILATPAIVNGCIYLRSDKYLYCIGKK